MTYTCPVCYYAYLVDPPRNYTICPCCGTEFENDDYAVSHASLREEWYARGAPWFSRFTPPPEGWNLVVALSQEAAAGIGLQPMFKIYWRIYKGPRSRIRSKIYSHTFFGMRGKLYENSYMRIRKREKKRGESYTRMYDCIDHYE